ncbi:Type I restriction enzyme EcoKI specificity protein [Legionella pneumophila]|uniref:restriction endonuclease subunit S n=1 Tax=Legionella pneumophila TaxID=446 RepID=UPI0007706D84|nr:restriction endonuclease subunit S [Legionella pneumophila]CZH48076.1 Type I restriction enzyme EcoKI specificity protein [Legionella pneumophila]
MEQNYPKTWAVEKLGDVMDVQGGSQPPKAEFIYEPKDGYVQLLQIRDFGDKPVPTYVPMGRVSKFCKKTDVLIARYGASLGRIVRGLEGAYNVALAKTIYDERLFEDSYVFYLLKTPLFQTPLKMISRSAQNGFARHEIAHVELPIPPLNEQKRIVAKIEELFSELDNGIAALKTVQEQLKVYRQAILKHAFEGKLTAKWREENVDKLETSEQLLARIQKERDVLYQQQLEEWKETVKKWEAEGKEGKKPKKPVICKPMQTISEDEINVLPRLPADWRYIRLAEISAIGSGMSVSQNRKLNKPVEVAYLRVANVQRGLLNLSEIKTMLVEQEALADLVLEKGDVLFNEGGDRDKLGRGWIWENQIESCITQNHVFRATPIIKNEFHSKFISHWGNSFGKDYFEKGGKQTTNLASINKTVLSNFPVPLPSFEEQHQIISILDDAMSLMDAFDSEIKRGFQRVEILRQSILKKAFSGQLVKQDPNDEPASELLVRIKAQEESQKQPAKKTATKGAQKKVSQEAWN